MAVSSSMQQLMDKVPRHIVFPYPRTVILLAGTTASASTSCPSVKSMADVSTSVFSQSIEAITEYCRIMWDLFPVDKAMVSVFAAGSRVFRLTDWTPQQQCLQYLLDNFAAVTPGDSPVSMETGLKCVAECLLQPSTLVKDDVEDDDTYYSCTTSSGQYNTQTQHATQPLKSPVQVSRVLCLLPQQAHTFPYHFLQESGVLDIPNVLESLLAQSCGSVNGSKCSCKASNNLSRCSALHVELVLLKACEGPCPPGTIVPSAPTPHITCTMKYVQKADLYAELEQLSFFHFGLATCRISGIAVTMKPTPPKDSVETQFFFHPFPHMEFPGMTYLYICRLPKYYRPIEKRVATNSQVNFCRCAHRVTPRHPWKQESLAVVKHVLSYKTFMLGTINPPELQNHNGIIYLHCLNNLPFPTDNLPLSTYKIQTTTFRVREFVELIDCNMLYHPPQRVKDAGPAFEPPECDPLSAISLARNEVALTPQNIERSTRYWPWLLSETILFGADQHEELKKLLDPLKRAIMLPSLSKSAAESTAELLSRLHQHALNNESKLFPHLRTAGTARRDVFRKLWSEVYLFISKCDTSVEHRSLLVHMETIWPEPLRLRNNRDFSLMEARDDPLPEEDEKAIFEKIIAAKKEEELTKEKERQLAASLAKSDLPAPPQSGFSPASSLESSIATALQQQPPAPAGSLMAAVARQRSVAESGKSWIQHTSPSMTKHLSRQPQESDREHE